MSKIIQLKISGMHCGSCATLIEQNLGAQSGVDEVKVNYSSGAATIEFDEGKITQPEILEVIKISGDYNIEEVPVPEARSRVIPFPTAENGVASAPAFVAGNLTGSFNNLPARMLFIAGFLGGLAIISIVLNFFLGFLLLSK